MKYPSTHADRALLAVALAALLLAWPPAISWLAATLCLWFAYREFGASFRKLESEGTSETVEEPTVKAAPLPRASIRHETRTCDMQQVMATLAARENAPPAPRPVPRQASPHPKTKEPACDSTPSPSATGAC